MDKIPTSIEHKPLNKIIGVIIIVIIVYCGPIVLVLNGFDIFAWFRSSEFLYLVLGVVGLYVVYALVNPDKYDVKIPKSETTIIQTPADCEVCGRTFDRKKLHELPASHKLLCDECLKLIKY